MKDYYKDECFFINFSKVSIVKDVTEKIYTHYMENDHPTLEGEIPAVQVIIGNSQIYLEDEKAVIFNRDFNEWLKLRDQGLCK